MRTLIYKRTHTGDPNPSTGVFGNNDCMGSVRKRQFEAVIGIGGIGPEAISHGIAGKLNWIGIGPIYGGRDPGSRGPRLRFRHFWYRGEVGPALQEKYPALAAYIYNKNRRSFIHSPSPAGGRLDQDVKNILRLAEVSLPSKQLANRGSENTGGECRVRPIEAALCSQRRGQSNSRGRHRISLAVSDVYD